MSIFKCKHPFDKLDVLKEATKELFEDIKFRDSTRIIYHFKCSKCGAELDSVHALIEEEPTNDN